MRSFSEHSKDLPAGIALELGSGGGFLKEVIPNVTTSDVRKLDGVENDFSALEIPYDDESVKAIYMMNVFHHLQDCSTFLKEAERVLAPNGKILMLEHANTLWGRFVYRYLHHEPFDPGARDWDLPPGGPMSSANAALPWIVFVRDVEKFNHDFPSLQIEKLSYCFPLLYLLSGGVSYRQFLPNFTLPMVRGIESLLSPSYGATGMFMRIVIKK